MPDLGKVIKGLQIERECVSRDCDRDCGKCDLVQDRDWLLSVYDEAIELLKEQEPKTGHWIWLQFCANEGVYCSECHTKMFDRYPMKKKFSQFCGHCGAKMDDEVEGR